MPLPDVSNPLTSEASASSASAVAPPSEDATSVSEDSSVLAKGKSERKLTHDLLSSQNWLSSTLEDDELPDVSDLLPPDVSDLLLSEASASP